MFSTLLKVWRGLVVYSLLMCHKFFYIWYVQRLVLSTNANIWQNIKRIFQNHRTIWKGRFQNSHLWQVPKDSPKPFWKANYLPCCKKRACYEFQSWRLEYWNFRLPSANRKSKANISPSCKYKQHMRVLPICGWSTFYSLLSYKYSYQNNTLQCYIILYPLLDWALYH